MIIYAYIYENLPLWKVFSSDIGYTSSSISWRPQYHPNDPRHKIMVSIDYQGQGRPSPEAVMHFPPVSDLHPYFRKILRLCGKLKKFYIFPKKFPIFIRQNF